MERSVKGDVVVVPFPFSDLSNSKKRPAYVAADLKGDDIILCVITSLRKDSYSVSLDKYDFSSGSLHIKSSIRPNKLFTADKSIIMYKIGSLKQRKVKEVERAVVDIFLD